MARTGKSSNHPDRLSAAQKRIDAMKMRLKGKSLLAIGHSLGVTRQRAGQLIAEELEMRIKHSLLVTEEVRQLELDRLDRLLAGIWNEAKTGNLLAIDKALKISERRAKLLGLDAPVQHKVEQHNIIEHLEGMSDDELARQIERLEEASSIIPPQKRTH